MAERGVKGGAEGLALSGLAGGLSSAAASLEWAHIAVGEFEGNIHFAFEADGQWAHYLEDWNGEMRLSRWFVRDFVENAKIIPVPVLNTGGIMPAAAETAANCFTGACSALWGGW